MFWWCWLFRHTLLPHALPQVCHRHNCPARGCTPQSARTCKNGSHPPAVLCPPAAGSGQDIRQASRLRDQLQQWPWAAGRCRAPAARRRCRPYHRQPACRTGSSGGWHCHYQGSTSSSKGYCIERGRGKCIELLGRRAGGVPGLCQLRPGLAPVTDRAPAHLAQVRHSNAEWRQLLAPQAYAVLRQARTERPFSSPLVDVSGSVGGGPAMPGSVPCRPASCCAACCSAPASLPVSTHASSIHGFAE